MSTESATTLRAAGKASARKNGANTSELLMQYGCGPIPFVGTKNAFYEGHLVFDRVIDPAIASPQEYFESVSRSICGARCYLFQSLQRLRTGCFRTLARPGVLVSDYCLQLPDLAAYCEAHQRLATLYLDPAAWARKAILNVAASRKFLSERTIAKYAADIWKV